jgi:hypothetical protein
MTDYLALYDHGYDENCKVKDDDCCDNKNINIFNFYAPVYGDVSGFSSDHVSHIVGEDCDHDEDDEGDDDNGDDDNGDDENECPEFSGYDLTCPVNPYVELDEIQLTQYDNDECETAVNALVFYYNIFKDEFADAADERCYWIN